jgi:hypothetical protein
VGTGCERVMRFLRGQEMQHLIEEATGRTCPCKIGLRCPLDFPPADAPPPVAS